MSLSPKDDPRTWLVPGPRAVPRPPLEARLLYYDLATNECALLRTMCEFSRDGLGKGCRAKHETYALTSGLSVKTIGDLIHGRNYIDSRPPGFIGPMNARHIPGLIERRILIEDAPVKKPSRRLRRWHTAPAIYSVNEAALTLKREILERLEDGVQQTLPGIPLPPRPGQPVEVAPDHPAPGATSTRHDVPNHPAPRADDTKTLDTRTRDSKAGGIQKRPPTDFENIPGVQKEARDPTLEEVSEKLANNLGIPLSTRNLEFVKLGVAAEIAWAGLSPPEAARGIFEAVIEDQKRGVPIDRFYFEDAKWRRPNSNQQIKNRFERELEISRRMQSFESPPSLALPASEVVGRCKGCGRLRLTSSSWSEFCAESCRAQAQLAGSRGDRPLWAHDL